MAQITITGDLNDPFVQEIIGLFSPKKINPVAAPLPEIEEGSVFTKPEVIENTSFAEEVANQTGQVDHNRVPFNEIYCGKSKDPFNTTGPKKGQWKRRRGVEEQAYNLWYQSELDKLNGADRVDDEVNAAAAFGNIQQPAAQAQGFQQQPIPKTVGEYMAWLSQEMANGNINQADVDAAFTNTGLSQGNLFPPNSDAVVAKNIEILFYKLTSNV